ncbi:MAG: signal peptidase I [Deltaproteobacteria bacterium]|nr:MAG: signal peptidase I [Deltaproteobacteria bacterium]
MASGRDSKGPFGRGMDPEGSAMAEVGTRGGSQAGKRDKGVKPVSPRRLVRRAKELLKEGRTLLKKKGKRISEAGRGEVSGAIERLTAVVPTRKNGVTLDTDRVYAATMGLDDALATHLSRYRKSVTRELVEAVVWAVGLALIIRFFLIEAFSIPSGSMMPTLQIGDHLFINKIGYGIYIPFSPGRLVAWGQPDRGEIIVFEYHYPNDSHDGMDYIKRVIGKPGDRVRLENNVIWLNGKPIETEVLGEADCPVYQGDNAENPAAICRCVRQRETLDGRSWISQHIVGFVSGSNAGRCQTLRDSDDWPHETWPNGYTKYFGYKDTNPDWPEVVVPEGHVFAMGDNRDQSEDGRYWGFVPYDMIKGTAFVIWWARDKGRLFNWID